MTWPHRAQQSRQRYAAAMGFTILSALSAFEQRLNPRTPISLYAVIGRMGLGVPVGNEKLPVAHTRGGFYFGIIQCVNTASIWLALLYASKERKTAAPKAKSKAG